MSALLVDVSELAGKPGASKKIWRQEAVSGLHSGLGRVEEGDPVRLRLLAESLVEGVAVSGQISGRLHLSCSRCLAKYVEAFDQPVEEVYYFERAEEREGYQVHDRSIDLEPMVRDVIVLAIPIRPLHRPDCKGLCPACGADRNVADCGHREELVDLRWAPLRELLAAREEEES